MLNLLKLKSTKSTSRRSLLLSTIVLFGGIATDATAQQNYRESVSIPTAALFQPTEQTAVSHLLSKGKILEADLLWGDALVHYEEAIRNYPNDQQLKARFDFARLHYSQDRRFMDRSFRAALVSLSTQESSSLYLELLQQINSKYVHTPPWKKLIARGARSLEMALENKTFLTVNKIRANQSQIQQLQREIHHLGSKYAIRGPQDMMAVAGQIARLASHRVGLKESASYLELAASTAGGLDTYSSFLTADQLRDVYSQIEGNFVGLGVELKDKNGALEIVHIIPHSPAEKAGLKANDLIVKVGGQATKELTTDEAASLLTGEAGSLVQLSIISPGHAARQVNIRRDRVEVPALEDIKLIDKARGIAYLKIPAFQKTTSRDLEEAMWDLHRQGMASLIIDLRGNPGGLLTASVEIADKFITDGGIVSTKGRSAGEDFIYRAHRAGTWRVPLVVLIDGDSASASEIFAGAIRDSGRGKLVGTRSYGKGSVQGIFPLGNTGVGIRLTTAKFYSPAGHPISKVGVQPDIVVRLSKKVTVGNKTNPQANSTLNPLHDIALDAAVKVANELSVQHQARVQAASRAG